MRPAVRVHLRTLQDLALIGQSLCPIWVQIEAKRVEMNRHIGATIMMSKVGHQVEDNSHSPARVCVGDPCSSWTVPLLIDLKKTVSFAPKICHD